MWWFNLQIYGKGGEIVNITFAKKLQAINHLIIIISPSKLTAVQSQPGNWLWIKLTDAEIKRQVNRIKENKAKADASHQSWREILRGYIYRAGWSQKDFTQYTLLSETVYKRITGNQEKKLSLKSIVAVCLSLNLLPSESLEVIHKAGYSFDNSLVQCFYSTFIKERWTLDDADAALFAGTGERFTQMRD